MKSVDIKINSGVCSLQPAEHRDNPATTPVSHVVFLCPAFEGVLGWTGNILNTCRSLVIAVFNIPALVLNPLNRRITMKTAKKNLICKLAHDSARDLSLLRNITQQAPAIIHQNAQSISDLFMMVEVRLASINHQILKGVQA